MLKGIDLMNNIKSVLFASGKEPLLKCPQTCFLKPRSSAILLVRKPQSPVGGGSK